MTEQENNEIYNLMHMINNSCIISDFILITEKSYNNWSPSKCLPRDKNKSFDLTMLLFPKTAWPLH